MGSSGVDSRPFSDIRDSVLSIQSSPPGSAQGRDSKASAFLRTKGTVPCSRPPRLLQSRAEVSLVAFACDEDWLPARGTGARLALADPSATFAISNSSSKSCRSEVR